MQTKLDLYQRIAPLSGLGIWEIDLVNHTQYFNKIVHRILELDPETALQWELLTGFAESLTAINAYFDMSKISDVPVTESFSFKTASGDWRFLRFRAQRQMKDGALASVFGTIEDITDSVKMMMDLQEKEKRFSQAFDHAPIGMALVSSEGKWLKVNESICSLLGYAPESLMLTDFQKLTYPEDLSSDVEQMQRLIAGEIDKYSMEKRYFHAKGHLIWTLLSVSLVRDADGAPLYFVSQVKDISERKRNMQIIREQNDRLLSFAHIVSHNLRSHAGNIRMLTTFIEEEENPDEKASMKKMLDTNAEHLLETLDYLNEVVKIHDSGKVGMALLKLSPQVERVTDILSASIKDADATISVDIPNEIEVYFTAAYLESVIINLISNSLKYRKSEVPLHINIGAEKLNGEVVIRVADNGQGIDMERYGHKLFGMYNTFHQHHDARGLGLFLVKNHVEAMDGSIYAESRPGIGTTFIIHLKG